MKRVKGKGYWWRPLHVNGTGRGAVCAVCAFVAFCYLLLEIARGTMVKCLDGRLSVT